jgi:hypothetical protein
VLSALPPVFDAGATACRVARGPIELPFKAPATLVVRGESIDVVQNEDGRPRVASFAAGPLPASPSFAAQRETVDGGARVASAVGCAVAGDRAFCPDRSGAVHRAKLDASEDHLVASSRSGSRVAAASLGAHSALAYLASRKTSEGWVSEAWLAVDDDAPLRLSEDGSGATWVALAEHRPAGNAGGEVLAVYIDARTALTAMHARAITHDGRLKLGEDTVVFVGGPGDRRTGAAVAIGPGGSGWSLLPIARDVGTFGLAVVRIEAPPRVDEPVVWSVYPNGLDPAPIAAAEDARATWVARVLPESAVPGARRVLELGRIDAQGTFAPRDRVPTTGSPTDVVLAIDARGALWIAWLDSAGAWIERLSCPSA